MTNSIKLQELFNISDEDLKFYPIILNSKHETDFTHEMQDPLSFYVENQKEKLLEYIGFHKNTEETAKRLGKKAYSKMTLDNNQLPLQFVQMQKNDEWLFVGCYDHDKITLSNDKKHLKYPLHLNSKFSSYTGRLIINFKKVQGPTQHVLKKKNMFSECTVLKILPTKYTGDRFPGYSNIDVNFDELNTIIKTKKIDWYTALSNMKGVYIITDHSIGKHYIGSAYGKEMIWQRWCDYMKDGHGGDAQLKKFNFEYIRKNFRYSLLEIFPIETTSQQIIDRESYWKEVFDTRKHGYNSN